jgi:hypothetical protein
MDLFVWTKLAVGFLTYVDGHEYKQLETHILSLHQVEDYLMLCSDQCDQNAISSWEPYLYLSSSYP